VDADGVEQLLSQQLRQLLSPVDSVHKDDHLVEGQGVKQVGQLLKFLILVNVDIELRQPMKNQFPLINKDLTLLLQKLFAIFFDLLWHSSTEHHNLFMMWCFDKDVLNVGTHLRV